MADAPPDPLHDDDPAQLRAYIAELEGRLARRNAGRGARVPTTSDARLVARVLALGWTRAGLLRALGYKPGSAAILSRCNGDDPVPLPEATRARLREMATKKERPETIDAVSKKSF